MSTTSPAAAVPTTTSVSPTTLDPSDDFKRHACSSFLAGDENVRIVPSFTYGQPIELLSRTSIGPLTAGMDTVVPLWLAVLLRQRNMARILAPDWMSPQNLKSVLQFEKDPTKASFSSELPFRYQEIARSILSTETELEQAAEIKILLEDISTVRMDKIKANLHTLSEQSLSQPSTLPIIDVTHIGSLELATYKPFIVQAFRSHLTLTRSKKLQQENKGRSTEETRDDAMRSSTTSRGKQLGDSEELAAAAPPVRSRLRRFR